MLGANLVALRLSEADAQKAKKKADRETRMLRGEVLPEESDEENEEEDDEERRKSEFNFRRSGDISLDIDCHIKGNGHEVKKHDNLSQGSDSTTSSMRSHDKHKHDGHTNVGSSTVRPNTLVRHGSLNGPLQAPRFTPAMVRQQHHLVSLASPIFYSKQ